MTNLTVKRQLPHSGRMQVHKGEIMRALDAGWLALRRDHPDILDALLIIDTDAVGRWGDAHPDLAEGAAVRVNPPMVYITNERLTYGGVLTFQSLMHMAVHMIANARGIQETSRQDRYHNRQFANLAYEVGLEYPAGTAGPTYGFAAVKITEASKKKYSAEIFDIDRALSDYQIEAVVTRRPVSRTRLLKATCKCDLPFIIRVSAYTLEQTSILCGTCKKGFEVRR